MGMMEIIYFLTLTHIFCVHSSIFSLPSPISVNEEVLIYYESIICSISCYRMANMNNQHQGKRKIFQPKKNCKCQQNKVDQFLLDFSFVDSPSH